MMPTITPFLWFDTQAEEVMNFYASIFKRSKVISVHRAQEKVMSVRFELEGQSFIALNAGPEFTFTEAVSFFVGWKPSRKSMNCGQSSPRMAARPADAAG
jgi:predicted 3-demethylubiquinone-9 3-methyltransferase (glyoxalase superfamily)